MSKYFSQIKWFSSLDIITILYLVIAITFSYIYGIRIEYGFLAEYQYDLKFLGVVVFFFYVFIPLNAVYYCWHSKEEFCGPGWRSYFMTNYLTFQRFYDLIKILLYLKVILVVHTCIKQTIPIINPIIYDYSLLSFDTWIHFGVNPCLFLTKNFGEAYIGDFIDRAYFFWYLIKGPVLALMIVVPKREVTLGFFKAYFLLWIIGGLCALILPSVGPVYINPEWFENLAAPMALDLQQQLWGHYLNVIHYSTQPTLYLYEGVAAFPSLHVGVAFLYAFFFFRLNKVIGILMGVFALITQFGSVYLGWHYAVDGYFGAILSYLLYRICVPKDAHKSF